MASGAIPRFDEFVKSGAVPTFDEFAAQDRSKDQRVGGQKVLDYTNETLSNVPGSAVNFAKNIYSAVRHPIDTAKGVGQVAVGALEKMTPGFPETDETKMADAAGHALKDRYGSVDAIANTIKTDPVGAAADASVVAGGVSGVARGAGAAARAANLPRVAGAAADVSRGAALASDIANPLTLPLKAVGAASKGTARGMAKSALGLPGKAERYGAPAQAALEETKGILPSTIKASAAAKLDELNKQLEALATASGNTADLAAARKVVADAIAKVKAANGIADDLVPMQAQLAEARPGFGGAVTPSGDVAQQQHPLQFLKMKRQFGDDFTKFDAAVPQKNSTRSVGNKAYHEMSSEFNRAVPEGADLNQRMQSLVPVKEGAQRAEEKAGGIQRSVDRATRPTGGLAAALFAAHQAGIPGAIAAMTVQEALATPSVRMALARLAHGAGKVYSSPITRRAGTSAGVAGKSSDTPPRFARGGIAGRHGPEKIIVGDGGEPEAIIPISRIRAMGPQAQRRLLKGIGSHLGIGTKRKSTLGEELAYERHI